jgi:low affinity Fe/Cu permease
MAKQLIMKPDEDVKPAEKIFDKIATKVTRATGSPAAFAIAALVIIVWAVTGPLFHFSDTWQLVINTGTTIITFLMVFIIQQSANKDTVAIHLKLNELIAANKNASNQLVDIEDLTERQLQTVKEFYVKLADKAQKEEDVTKSHSFAEIDKKADNPDAGKELINKKNN